MSARFFLSYSFYSASLEVSLNFYNIYIRGYGFTGERLWSPHSLEKGVSNNVFCVKSASHLVGFGGRYFELPEILSF